MFKTPILFLIFNRPDLTSKVFEQIRKIKPAKLFIAADGPRNQEESKLCEQARKIIEEVDWNCEVKTLFRDKNLGLRKAVTGALDWFFENVEQGIILEDDCLANESFFKFCEIMLNHYKNNEKIMHIAGSNFQDSNWHSDGSYYFSQISAQCWGWATWRRAWEFNRPQMEGFDEFLSSNKLENLFNDTRFIEFWKNYYSSAYEAKINSWNAVWSYSIVSNNGLCVIPNKNLVSNIGFGEEASNCVNNENPLANLEIKDFNKLIEPSKIEPINEADYYIINKYHYPEPIKEEKKKKKFFQKKESQISKKEYFCIKGNNTSIYEEARINNLKSEKESIIFGENSHIRGEFYTFPNGGYIKIGSFCYVGENSRIWSSNSIEIGDRVLIAHDVNIFDSNTHPIDPIKRHEHFKNISQTGFPEEIDSLEDKPIIIEDDVWVGAKCTIMQGITIGEGSIIGANSIVTKDIEPYKVYAGNPAVYIKDVPIEREINEYH